MPPIHQCTGHVQVSIYSEYLVIALSQHLDDLVEERQPLIAQEVPTKPTQME